MAVAAHAQKVRWSTIELRVPGVGPKARGSPEKGAETGAASRHNSLIKQKVNALLSAH